MTCARSFGEGGEPKPASPVAPADASSPKNAVQLLQDYTRLVSPENIDEVFDLFSEDALLEFPFFKSIGIPARLAGRETIRKQIAPFVKNETENYQHGPYIWTIPPRYTYFPVAKETTQSTIVRKLSAHARNNRTKRALWEYDSIHRSLYLLNYIDSPALRQHVQRALNRGENYHQLCRAVSFASFGKIRFKTAFEQDLWLECSRLIANSIIFYNASILSRLLEHQERIGDMQAADATKKVSPVAWQHINLHGRYEFLKQLDPINVGAIIRELTKIPINHEAPLAA